MAGRGKQLSRLVALLQARGFLNSIKTSQGLEVSYGPLGALMRRNIQEKWLEVMVQKQKNVFLVEHPPSLQNISDQDRESLQQNCLSEYPQVLKLTNGQLPFSIASVGLCKNCASKRLSEDQEFFLGSPHKTQLILQNYTPPTGSSRVLDYWLQLRLSWWKKFSRNPAKFHTVSSSNGESENPNGDPALSQTTVSIVYDFPWGQECVEDVSNLGDSLIKTLPEDKRKLNKRSRDTLPHCIQCSTSVEMALSAWLIDSFCERTSLAPYSESKAKRQNEMVLQLHNEITSYQVAITREPVSDKSSTSSEDGEILTQMFHISEKLEMDLQQAGVSVFNASSHGASLIAHFKRNDQLGIPFTVILNTDTLDDGVVSIRNRDTEIKESSHISTVTEKLKKYLSAEME